MREHRLIHFDDRGVDSMSFDETASPPPERIEARFTSRVDRINQAGPDRIISHVDYLKAKANIIKSVGEYFYTLTQVEQDQFVQFGAALGKRFEVKFEQLFRLSDRPSGVEAITTLVRIFKTFETQKDQIAADLMAITEQEIKQPQYSAIYNRLKRDGKLNLVMSDQTRRRGRPGAQPRQQMSGDVASESIVPPTEADQKNLREAIGDYEQDRNNPLAKPILAARLEMLGWDARSAGDPPSAERCQRIEGTELARLIRVVVGTVKYALLKKKQQDAERR